MPLQLWVQAARAGLRIKEVGVPRLYLDPNRAFGGMLNDAAERLAYYRRVIDSRRSRLPYRLLFDEGVPVNVPRAPQQDGAVVAVPPLQEIGPMLGTNRRLLRVLPGTAGPRVDRSYARSAREAAVAAARDYLRGNGEPLPSRRGNGIAPASRASTRVVSSRRLGQKLRTERPGPTPRCDPAPTSSSITTS